MVDREDKRKEKKKRQNTIQRWQNDWSTHGCVSFELEELVFLKRPLEDDSE